MGMVRSPKSITGAVGATLGNAPYKILKTFYTREDAEKDFAIRDRLWEARYDALEKEQPKKYY